MSRKILVVDDDARIRESLSRVLSAAGTEVCAIGSAEEALGILGEVRPDLVISDVRMPGLDGLELLRLLRERKPDVDVALMTAYDDLPTAAAAMREGAADFLVKPLDLHQLRTVVDKIFADRRARARRTAPSEGTDKPVPRLIGHDPSMLEIFKLIGQLAASRASVIIRGESGTGKELIARAIHETSPAANEPFIVVDCTAIPASLLESELFGHVRGSFTGATADRRGRFAMAGSGTILLDEIGDTAPELQAKLLRVLQEQEYYRVGAERPERTEARVLAATHCDLEAMVSNGEFREDLYYRLRVVEIVVPPLRERRGDIPELAEFLVRRAAGAAKGGNPPLLSDTARAQLLAHDWPGNVRELENCLTRAVVLATGGVIHPEHLALGDVRLTDGGSHASLDEVEAAHVARVLRDVRGNRTRAAEILGISRPRLRRLIERYGIEDDGA
jgi:DNA-binding NtrC family response regulator